MGLNVRDRDSTEGNGEFVRLLRISFFIIIARTGIYLPPLETRLPSSGLYSRVRDEGRYRLLVIRLAMALEINPES